jgi:hypothetical protein
MTAPERGIEVTEHPYETPERRFYAKMPLRAGWVRGHGSTPDEAIRNLRELARYT